MLNIFFNLDHAVGAHSGTHSASNAFFLICYHCRVVALLIDSRGVQCEYLLGTYFDAETAALASVGIECDLIHYVSSGMVIGI